MTAECPYTLQWDALPLKIVPSHGGSGPPSNTWFPGPSRVLNPNSISIGSAVFAGLTSVTDRQTSQLFFTARLRPQFQMPLVRGSVVRIRGMMRTQHFSIRTSLSSAVRPRRQYTAAARYDRREVAGMTNFKMYLLRQFCSNRVEFFYTTQKTPVQKMMDDQNFEIRIL